jgi:hypothetical protein
LTEFGLPCLVCDSYTLTYYLHSTSTFIMKLSVSLCVSLLALLPSIASAQDCSSDLLDAVYTCLAANPCVCSACEVSTTTETMLLVGGGGDTKSVNNCKGLTTSVCPLVTCCQACTAEMQAWYECLSQEAVKSTCDLSCLDYSPRDATGCK